MIEGADLKEISYNSPQGSFSATYEGGQEVTIDLGGIRNEDGKVDATGKPIKSSSVMPATAELSNIGDDNGTYEIILGLLRDGAVGEMVLTLVDGRTFKFEDAFFVGDTNLNLKTGMIGAKINASAFPKSKKIS